MMPKPLQNQALLINANAMHIPLADNSVHAVFTSPSYWSLRDYGTGTWQGGDPDCSHKPNDTPKQRGIESSGLEGGQKSNGHSQEGYGKECLRCGAIRIDNQLGLEQNPDCLGWATGKPCGECYTCHMVQVFREVKRVLRDDGIFFLNLGDTAWGGKGQSGSQGKEFQQRRVEEGVSFTSPAAHIGGKKKTKPNDGKHPIYKPLDICGIPGSVAKALQCDGWFLRMDLIWKKENGLPESVNGTRWEKHRVKIESCWNENNPHPSKMGNINYNRKDNHAKYIDCPGCEKCSPNGGYILRQGSWRPSRGHEYVFMFTKSPDYFCDADAVRQTHAPKSLTVSTTPRKGSGVESTGEKLNAWLESSGNGRQLNPNGANPRSVFSPEFCLRKDLDAEKIADLLRAISNRETFDLYDYFEPENFDSVVSTSTEPLKLGHYAAFPTWLVRKILPAAISKKGCCAKCGKQWARVVDKKSLERYELSEDDPRFRPSRYNGKYDEIKTENGTGMRYVSSQILGWKPTCDCNAEIARPIVLDPFAGTGTVGIVAAELGANFIGLDLNLDYLRDFAGWRLEKKVSKKMAVKATEGLPLFGEQK